MNETQSSTRKALIRSATATLTSHPSASIEEIAQRAGVGRATLYRHFGSRDGLLRELTREAITATDHAMAQIPTDITATEMLRHVVDAMVPLGDRFHFLAQESEAMKDPDIAAEIERQHRETRELVAAVKLEGTIAPEVPDAWVATALDALIYAAWTSTHEGWIARREAPALVFRTLVGSLGPDQPDR